jgi:hypothetical protein
MKVYKNWHTASTCAVPQCSSTRKKKKKKRRIPRKEGRKEGRKEKCEGHQGRKNVKDTKEGRM